MKLPYFLSLFLFFIHQGIYAISLFHALLAKHLAALESKDPFKSSQIQSAYLEILEGYSLESLESYIEPYNADEESFLSAYLGEFLLDEGQNYDTSIAFLRNLEARKTEIAKELQTSESSKEELQVIQKQIEFLSKFPHHYRNLLLFQGRNDSCKRSKVGGLKKSKRSNTCSISLDAGIKERNSSSEEEENAFVEVRKGSSNTSLSRRTLHKLDLNSEKSTRRREFVSILLDPITLSVFEMLKFRFEFFKNLPTPPPAIPINDFQEESLDFLVSFSTDRMQVRFSEEKMQEFASKGMKFFEMLLENKNNFKRVLNLPTSKEVFDDLWHFVLINGESSSLEISTFARMREIVFLADFLMLENVDCLVKCISKALSTLPLEDADNWDFQSILNLPISIRILESLKTLKNYPGHFLCEGKFLCKNYPLNFASKLCNVFWLDQSIESIEIVNCPLGERDIFILDQWLRIGTIKSLYLSHNRLNGDFFAELKNVDKLEKLHISYNPIENSSASKIINNLWAIRELELINCQLNQLNVHSPIFSQLSTLKLNYNPIKIDLLPFFSSPNLISAGFSMPHSMEEEELENFIHHLSISIREIDFSGSKFEDAVILKLLVNHLPNLNSLNFSDTGILINGALEEFKELENFHSLVSIGFFRERFPYSDGSFDIFEIIGKIRSLKCLDLSYCHFDENEFGEGISKWNVEGRSCKLEELKIAPANPNEELDYYLNVLVKNSRKFSHLKRLYISGEMSHDSAISDRLVQLIPGLEIFH